MTILYFTSTGNCLSVAKRIGGKLISIPQAIHNEPCVFEDDAIGLVFPVYGLSVPPIVLEFLRAATLKTDYLFAVLTYGTYDAGSATQLAGAAAERGLTFSYIGALHMQENYLPAFAMEKQKAPSSQAERLEKISADIAARKTGIKHNTWFDRFMTKKRQSNFHYSRGEGVTREYRVADGCTGCKTCARVCPTGNIRIENGRPVFGQNCLSCLACIQNCPQNALHHATEKSAVRYRNPDVALSELIAANEQQDAAGGSKAL